ncbi:MAG: HD domain-containing protein, partial [Nanoarchaeota archaeon]|nr:HD domain-containing protein [Nanoarchaeota archaeon]
FIVLKAWMTAIIRDSLSLNRLNEQRIDFNEHEKPQTWHQLRYIYYIFRRGGAGRLPDSKLVACHILDCHRCVLPLGRPKETLKYMMINFLEEELTRIAEERQVKDDPSHDFEHIRRVLFLAKEIGEREEIDFDVLIPAVLFHDTVAYRKDSPESLNETEESAIVAGDILHSFDEYPKEKIVQVQACIRECSFTKGLQPSNKESTVLQDADLLESTGAISILRTFSSCGQMKRHFYNRQDPFRKNTEPDISGKAVTYGLDLFYARLLKAGDRIHTDYAKKISNRRTQFLRDFLAVLEVELEESGVISSNNYGNL